MGFINCQELVFACVLANELSENYKYFVRFA